MTYDSTTHRITRLPRAFDARRGQDARAHCPDLTGKLAQLIEGAAGCSPYLADLMRQEGGWVQTALIDPEAAAAQVIADVRALAQPDPSDPLRQAKRRIALLSGLADLGGIWPLEQVTTTLTDLADAAVDTALRAGVAMEVKRRKLPAAMAEHHPITVLAMGKMGAFELNYSSDIDLICLFDETQINPDDILDLRPALVRAVRRMAGFLGDVTAQGYVFRTDLRLRPDASVTPVCMPMIAAEHYYESLGRTWERAAYIKARACAGDIEAGQRFLATLRPFVWRRHLDFAAIQDAHDMRLRIRSHKGQGGPIRLPGHNMKLGRGGIREIELFTQTRQLIAGGRDSDLRTSTTIGGLAGLAAAGWIPQEVADTLSAHYRMFREVEHRVQMIADQQTHVLPSDDEGLRQLADFMGRDLDELSADLMARLAEVDALAEQFFAPDGPAPEAEQDDFGADVVEGWARYPALRSPRAVEIFERLRPDLLARLRASPTPEQALSAFDGFLAGLPAGVQVFSMFEANPPLVDLLIDISSASPDLARYLSQHSAVLEAVIAGDFFAPWPGRPALLAEAQAVLATAEDYEAVLAATRRWRNDLHFRIGVHLLRQVITPVQAGQQYSDLAEVVLQVLWPQVVAEFSRKHGAPPGRGAVVLGMGSLGAGWLTAQSDLDLIVIYDAQGAEGSDGPRPLATTPYYARLTQALITALSAQMGEGRLYEADMRLRPSGRNGPVATSITAFETYQMTEAWTWEHLALTRARPLAGPDDMLADLEALRMRVLSTPGDPAQIRADVQSMRDRLAAAHTTADPQDAKLGAGRMQDIELLAQTAALLTGIPARGLNAQLDAAQGWIASDDIAVLRETYAALQALRAVQKLLGAEASAGRVAHLLGGADSFAGVVPCAEIIHQALTTRAQDEARDG